MAPVVLLAPDWLALMRGGLGLVRAARRWRRWVPVGLAGGALPLKLGRRPGWREWAAAVGLSVSAYLHARLRGRSARWAERWQIEARAGGGLLRVRAVAAPVGRRGGGKRGQVVEFSRAARRRQIVRFAEFRREVVERALFVTLTYHENFQDARAAKKHLRAFLARLLRRFPAAGWLWRIEVQRRGAIHFHLAVLGLDFLPHEWVARAWAEVVAGCSCRCDAAGVWRARAGGCCVDMLHLAAGTQVERVRSYQHANYYLSKYLGKASEGPEPENLGRRWACGGRWVQYLAPVRRFEVRRGQVLAFVRVLDRARAARARAGSARRRGQKIRRGRRRIWRGRSAFWLCDVDTYVSSLAKLHKPPGRVVGDYCDRFAPVVRRVA